MEKTPRAKRDSPNPIWKEGDRMPIGRIPADDIVRMNTEECYARLKDFHGIERGDVFERPPANGKWSERALLHVVLCRLEGHKYAEIAFAMGNPTDHKGTELSSLFDEDDARSMTGAVAKYCYKNIRERMRSNSSGYASTAFAIREFPQQRLEKILEVLGVKREELFAARPRAIGASGGTISTRELLRVLELRLSTDHLEEIIERLVQEGNRDLGLMDSEKARALLKVQFSRNFSVRTRAAFKAYIANTRGQKLK